MAMSEKESFLKDQGIDCAQQLAASATARRKVQRATAKATLAVLEDIKNNPNRYKNRENVWINKTNFSISDPTKEDQRNLYKLSIEKLRSTCHEMLHSQLRQNDLDLVAAAGDD